MARPGRSGVFIALPARPWGRLLAGRTGALQLEHKVRDLNAVLARRPGSAQLRLTRDLHRLQPRQRQALQRSLPITKGQVLAAALVATHAFAREQGHER